MFCQNCGHETEENLKFCPNCGERLNPKKTAKKSTLIIIILLAIITLSSLVLVSFFAFDKLSDNMKNKINIELPKNETNEYKSLKTINIDELDTKTAISTLNQQEQDLKEYFSSNQTKEQNDEIFTIFYSNACDLVEALNKKANEQQIAEIDFIKTINTDNLIVELNFSYLLDNYAEKLSAPFVNYLKFKEKEQNKRGYMPLWSENNLNENITKADIVEYLNKLKILIGENPDFPLWYQAMVDKYILIDAFLRPSDNETITREENISLFKKVINLLDEGSFTKDCAKELYELYLKNSLSDYQTKYTEWKNSAFYDDTTPIITQSDMSIHSYDENIALEKKFLKKAYEFKKLDLNDGGAVAKYINSYAERIEEFELLAYPKANDDDRQSEYGTIFPLLINSYDETIRKLELYTYQKIVDTYSDNYEHDNIITMRSYSECYDKIAQGIINSKFTNDKFNSYIENHEKRKALLKDTVNFKMNEIDFSIWFDKLEIYTYKVVADEINLNHDYDEEINKIFKQH